MNTKGKFLLDRNFFEWCNATFKEEKNKPFTKREAFLYIISITVYDKMTVTISDAKSSKVVELGKGCFYHSNRTFQSIFNWKNPVDVSRFLTKLEKSTTIKKIKVDGLSNCYYYQLVNFEKYQHFTDVTQNVTQSVTQNVTNNYLNNNIVTDTDVTQNVTQSVTQNVTVTTKDNNKSYTTNFIDANASKNKTKYSEPPFTETTLRNALKNEPKEVVDTLVSKYYSFRNNNWKSSKGKVIELTWFTGFLLDEVKKSLGLDTKPHLLNSNQWANLNINDCW